MPVDLPLRKALTPSKAVAFDFHDRVLMLAIVCLTVALASMITHAPASYRTALSAAVYEDMLRGP